MRKIFTLFALCLALAAPAPALAQTCYADYKAKQNKPLRLHYGVMQLNGPCRKKPARAEVSARLAAQGWTLLNVLSVFGPEGLDQRRANAGAYYLSF